MNVNRHLDERTPDFQALVEAVRRWLDEPRFRPRLPPHHPSKLDPFKATIRRLLEHYPYSAAQILHRLREVGYDGGVTIVKDYLQRVRPVRAPAFLTLHFAPGQCAQVDWGHYRSVPLGNTRRRLSFFVMVRCYRPMMYVEFTVSQTLEHFLQCHLNAFEFFNARAPAPIMVDNLKSAVLQRSVGQAPVFHPRYADFARHHRFEISPCNVGAGHEKGRAEAGVGYVKKNFLAGLDIADFRAVNPAARRWLDGVANVRIHGETRKRPVDLFALERDRLHRLPELLYDLATVHTVRASNRFRVTFDTHRYSVPAEYASQRLTLKSSPERLCLYHHERLVARHLRSDERHRDFEHPDHPRALLEQRRKATTQRLLQRFVSLTPRADEYYRELEQRRLNPVHHVRKIVALSDIYGTEATARALNDAFEYGAFSSDYLTVLERLIEGEANLRRDRSIERRIRLARFPVKKTLDSFDWSWPKKINRLQAQNLFRLRFLDHTSNVVFVGGVGLGKSHLVTALALRACHGGHSVLFTSAIDAVNTLAAAKAAGQLKRDLRRYLRPRLLILDELGYLPIDKTGADLLFQIISQRYEQGSIATTTNRVYKHWPEIFNHDPTLTSAVLDRLLHHAQTVTGEGLSFRMKEVIDTSPVPGNRLRPIRRHPSQ